MPQDDLPQTSKDGRSAPDGWSAEEWWAEKTSRSHRRNMTPLQRQRLARFLRLLRRERFQEARSAPIE